MDILLTTTDAEILFLNINGTLFHGETIKVSSNPFTYYNYPIGIFIIIVIPLFYFCFHSTGSSFKSQEGLVQSR